MKIYIITSGQYSDYSISGATTDKEQAEAWIKKQYEKLKAEGMWDDEYDEPFYGDTYSIEEYDSDCIGKWLNGYKVWEVYYDMAGNIEKLIANCNYFCHDERATYIEPSRWNSKEQIMVSVYARSREEAVKIAAEKRVRFIHEQDLKALRGEE